MSMKDLASMQDNTVTIYLDYISSPLPSFKKNVILNSNDNNNSIMHP